MKNQYIGNINDFFKYSILETIEKSFDKKILVVWMLTKNERMDIEFNDLRKYNKELFQKLRCVKSIEAIYPKYKYQSTFLAKTNRMKYFSEVKEKAKECDLLFFDPDIGISFSSDKKDKEHLYWDEIKEFWEPGNEGKDLIIYQHLDRQDWDEYLSELNGYIKNDLNGAFLVPIKTRNVMLIYIVHKNIKEKLRDIFINWDRQIKIIEPKEFMTLDLKEEYRFENYFAEDDNKAFLIAKKISENPGKEYNPVLFYGGTGTGKTHLIQAIGHELRKNNNIIYTTAELFVEEFIASLQKDKMRRFRDKYCKTNALLIDDINFIQNKPETQAELRYIFDILYNRNIQMVFTSDKPLSDISRISKKIISLFNKGLTIEISPPCFECKCEIIKRIAKNKKLILEQATIEKIAAGTKNDIGYIISSINYIKLENSITDSNNTKYNCT
jgi:chromosomal replication initiation ATPase DnaA